MKFFVLLFIPLLLFSKAQASEMVKVRITTFNTPQIKIFENSVLKQTLETKDLKEFTEIKIDNLQINSRRVPSRVVLHHKKNNEVDVIGVLEMEDYLRGVLPQEMPLVWPIEALKAQAIVARSFTKRQMIARKNNPYHLDSTVSDQMYLYDATFTAAEKTNLEKAILETRSEVLLNEGGNSAKTLYHADCGGQTEKASQVWGQKEVEFSVKDAGCPATPYSKWEVSISSKELMEKLKTDYLPKELNISEESLSHRAAEMEIIGLNPEDNEKFSSQDFRRLIGYKKLRSTKFQVSKINEGFLFKGSGYGHGVGLCQWGAKSWAQRGLNYKEILKHYFPSYVLSR